jgi:hypothetical protein
MCMDSTIPRKPGHIPLATAEMEKWPQLRCANVFHVVTATAPADFVRRNDLTSCTAAELFGAHPETSVAMGGT